MADSPPKTPPKPADVPAPGSVPKLPQTIFNLEKRGGASDAGGTQRPTGR